MWRRFRQVSLLASGLLLGALGCSPAQTTRPATGDDTSSAPERFETEPPRDGTEQEGVTALPLELPRADGTGTWVLRDALAKGPVVLIFYRGHW